MPQEFSTAKMAAAVDIAQRMIHTYVERGYIKPSIQEWRGPGTKVAWSYSDLCQVAVVKRFQINGFRVERIRELVEETVFSEVDDVWTVMRGMDKDQIFIGVLDDKSFSETRPDGFSISMKQIRASIDKRITEI